MIKLSIAQRLGIALIVIVLLVFVLLGPAVHLLTESWWFIAVDFADVFWTQITWQVGVGAIALLFYGGLLWGNFAIASRLTRYNTYIVLHELGLHHYIRYVPNLVRTLIVVLAVNGGVIFGQAAWETTLKFLNRTSFDYSDPIYNRDVGFYLFDLPFYQQIHGWLLGLLLWCLVLALTLYGLKGAIEPDRGWQYALRGGSKVHLSLLLAAIALLVAAGFWLQRYGLLYSSSGVVFGAGYTDVHAQEQAYWIMSVATLVLAGLFIGSLWRVSLAIPLYGFGIYIVALVVLTGFYPQFQQRFIVEPNELAKETPYIAHNIDFT
ncbi:MAG: COG1615 family transporter, partial [Cyanothece sp. SIO2G6]|nr:COG1615 family transporter [Cyanothece sp. SIO2G6]